MAIGRVGKVGMLQGQTWMVERMSPSCIMLLSELTVQEMIFNLLNVSYGNCNYGRILSIL